MFKKQWFVVLVLALVAAFSLAGFASQQTAVAQTQTPDHSVFPQLAGPFEKPTDVTAACLTCHPNAAKEIMGTVHWKWSYTDPITGQELGKNNVINNYCIALPSNEPRCTSCHIGYGYKDKSFFETATENNVDCLVCHADTAVYKKFPAGAGNPVLGAEPKEFPAGSGKMWEPVDLAKAAQSVRKPGRDNCGSCHFFGGGGDAVKHGDLDATMGNPAKDLDVHMSPDSLNMSCANCHKADAHNVPGMIYNGEARVSCQDCHTGDQAPHQKSELGAVLNQHTENLACQTCHIPAFARGEATKMSWDWSTAGQKGEDGKPLVKKDEAGHVIYDGQKGTFTSEQNVRPYYQWWNGQTMFLTVKDKIDPAQIVTMSDFQGSRGDGKIYPFKRFTGKQPYDKVNNILIVPNLFPNSPEDADAYWKGYDWQKAITSGMAYVGADYSGEYDFVETEFFWVQNHQVAPKENAVQCQECHTAEGGRLDFAALGYNVQEVAALTVFPPTLGEEQEAAAQPTLVPTEVPAVEQPTQAAAEPTPVPTAEGGSSTIWIALAVIAIIIVGAYLAFGRKK
ncbi:MAG: tetrathionate reductase family octaheme c-type cytochrome [Anaerolineales bacterium]